ncbi:hypothetical protein F4859DRAFT_513746 [Xylaria cf. heliscus]|nr:hypothetical protein F4859DRAFT_513746 [Xylaria cf. heliscus]
MKSDFCNPCADGDRHDNLKTTIIKVSTQILTTTITPTERRPQMSKKTASQPIASSTTTTIPSAMITFRTLIPAAGLTYTPGYTTLAYSVENLTVIPLPTAASPTSIEIPAAMIDFGTSIPAAMSTYTTGYNTLAFDVVYLTVTWVPSSTSDTSITANISSSSSSVSSDLASSVTANSTVQTSSTASSHAQSHSISNSAVAGLGTGVAIAGLLLGSLISFLFFRHHRKRQNQPVYIPQSEKGEIIPPNVRTTDPIPLEHFLLDPVPQPKISQELQSLGQLMQQHCETYYHLLPVHSSESELADNLSLLGIENGGMSRTTNTTTLLIDPATRLTAIRHIIAKAVFGSIAPVTSSGLSLLPPGVSDMTSRIPLTEENTGNHRATEAALTQWRQLSAFLLHPNRSDRTPLVPSDNLLAGQEHKLTVALNACLKPFVKGGQKQLYEQESHLEQVIRECATFGYLLFSQPSEYRLRFKNDEGGGMVVCPGLYKVVNDNGLYYQELVLAPVVESI